MPHLLNPTSPPDHLSQKISSNRPRRAHFDPAPHSTRSEAPLPPPVKQVPEVPPRNHHKRRTNLQLSAPTVFASHRAPLPNNWTPSSTSSPPATAWTSSSATIKPPAHDTTLQYSSLMDWHQLHTPENLQSPCWNQSPRSIAAERGSMLEVYSDPYLIFCVVKGEMK